MKRLKSFARNALDLIILILVCLSDLALSKWFKPYERGFFCNDDSLQYPFRENTVSVLTLACIVLIVPAAVIMAVELFKQYSPAANTAAEKRKQQQQTKSSAGCRFGERLLQCYYQLGYYLFGLALVLACCRITKFTVGRLRPHFMAVCQPQMKDGTTCADSVNQGRYIEEYECIGVNITSSRVAELRQSFPSGHACIFFYAVVYLAMYLQAALSTRASKLLKHLLQFIFIMCAWYVALTRISDYWHHWSDVLAGCALGTLVAVINALNVAKVFGRRAVRQQSVNVAPKPPAKPSASPSNSAKSPQTPPAAMLPAYTFGTLPYLPHPHAAAAAVAAAQQQAQYAQQYHNYGYVP